MSVPFGSNMNGPLFGGPEQRQVDFVQIRRLSQVLDFLQYDWLDVRENIMARRRTEYYMRVSAEVDASAEVLELERQWNPTGRQS